MTDQNELLIINKVLEGNTDAFGVLVDRYQEMAYTIAVRLLNDPDEAADIVQESFVKSYEVLDTFRGDAKFSTWIYRIVYRKSLDRLKAIRRRRTDGFGEMGEDNMLLGEVEDAFQLMMATERTELVKKAISALKPEEQTLILLYYFEDSPIRDIAEIMDMGMENVKVKMFRARKKLYNLLKGQIDHINI